MVSILIQISFRIIGIGVYLFLIHRWKKAFNIVSLLGATSLANIVLNTGCFFLHLYDSSKFPLTDDTKNVLFDAVLVLVIVLINDFKKTISVS